jgi:chemotaxis protein CheD
VKKLISIHIGELYASSEPLIIQTLLGSCVAVCLFDPVKGIGGMNHILLPGRADLKSFDDDTRYAINAMELLINKIMALGGVRVRLIAKVFGGANVIPGISKKYCTGEKNAAFVLDFLRIENIKVAGQDLGGNESRKIYFHTATGEVFLKRLHSPYDRDIAYEEQKFSKRIKKKAKKPGDVTLFSS